MDQHTLTNYITKSELDLCSPPSGQGRARQFCLIDVYQLVLMAKLARLCGQVFFVARWLNMLLWEDVLEQAIAEEIKRQPKGRHWLEVLKQSDFPDEIQTKKKWCKNIKTTPKLYHHRDKKEPIYIYTDSLLSGLSSGSPFTDLLFHEGVVVNATFALSLADSTLIKRARQRGNNV